VILFPAIDLKEGLAVRLQQGDMARATVFNRDPAAQAAQFAQQGFEYLHIVDLDGAFAGRPINAAAVDAILKAVKIPVQLGGGIRDRATIEGWLNKGITRVIIGTAAVRNPALVKEAARAFPGSMRAMAKLRSRAGLKRLSYPRSSSRAVLRTRALPPSSIPTCRATACSKALISMPRLPLPMRFRFP
jgi:phosphoribosylformimino-5-aminoimidazole carboxamide ribonucleotide (ProFAR) isomerase